MTKSISCKMKLATLLLDLALCLTHVLVSFISLTLIVVGLRSFAFSYQLIKSSRSCQMTVKIMRRLHIFFTNIRI